MTSSFINHISKSWKTLRVSSLIGWEKNPATEEAGGIELPTMIKTEKQENEDGSKILMMRKLILEMIWLGKCLIDKK